MAGNIRHHFWYAVIEKRIMPQIIGAVVPNWQLTFSGLAKVSIFTTNVNTENQCLFKHKCVCGALNRHFCQTRVSVPVLHLVVSKTLSIIVSTAFFVLGTLSMVKYFISLLAMISGLGLSISLGFNCRNQRDWFNLSPFVVQ